ncbi:hypothetical protein [Cyclobacterium sp. SYSU L10401]|uniref:hypothetical protein n=1 Tax=Cyclobacterium sp. SYSU L10401 TaxID=2678657 RepID=UPI0013D4AD61|nr:hypothetical protein [Cyclobacterium sp. SYSU L10401]
MKKPKEITIHNIKANQYREVFSDGASLGITPTGYFYLNFFSQRNAIPKGMVFELSDKGHLGELKSLTSDSKDGIVRQHEIGIYLDLKTCKNLRDLLDNKINEFEDLNKKGKK